MTGQPLIVERDRELDVLRSALAAGRDRNPSVVVLSGEPGIGKSHLLRSLRADHGETILRGYSLDADAPSYFPLRRAFGRLDHDGRVRASPAVVRAGRAHPLSGTPPAYRDCVEPSAHIVSA